MNNKYRITYKDSSGVVTFVAPSPLPIEQAREWMKKECERKGWEYIGVTKA